jgi:hypothetical protein
MVQGDNWLQRSAAYAGSKPQSFYDSLNQLLGMLMVPARAAFKGPITYASTTQENVGPNGDGKNGLNWTPFDIVALDHYRNLVNQDTQVHYTTGRSTYITRLESLAVWNKPIAITEFGCRAFLGSPETGPGVPIGPPVRDEQGQADYIVELAGIQEDHAYMNVIWSSPFQFIHPEFPYSTNPLEDEDCTTSYGIVKAVRDVIADDASPYHWEPKLAYGALAQFYVKYSSMKSAYYNAVAPPEDDGLLGLLPGLL